jgi:hypothetical protein
MKNNTIKSLIIIFSILIWLIILFSCINSRDVINQYQRGGVQPCGVCKKK